jgi:hypothetical protein
MQAISEKKIEVLRKSCHPEVFKRIPVNLIEDFKINHFGNVVMPKDKPFKRITDVTMIINGFPVRGTAYCSRKDNFCKKTGRELALKRAIRSYWKIEKEYYLQ